MVDFNLRELSAPIESLRPEVKAAYERLDAKWEAITTQLRILPIPCKVSYMFEEDPPNPNDGECLEFRKWKGTKRLCIASYSSGSGERGWEENCVVTPIEEWSGDQRVQMLAHVPDLFQVAVKQIKAFIEKTKEQENQ